MASLTSHTTTTTTTDTSAVKDEILDDDFFNIPATDDIAVEISPVEGYSEIKMLTSPFGAAMLSPNNENDNFSYTNMTDSSRTITATEGSASASSDNDDIPQWKKDLIQRRKTNIVKTIGANQSVTCPKKGFLDALESTKQHDQQADDLKKPITTIRTTISPVLPLITKLNSNNSTSCNSIKSTSSLDDSNSSEYLEITLNGGKRYENNYNNDELNISGNNNDKPAKNTIKIQHKQQYHNYEYNNKDINNDDDDDDNNDEIDNNYIETGISGGQYTINNIIKSGNTVIIKSPSSSNIQQEETKTTSQINNFSTPIPKLRNSLINNIISPTIDESTTTATTINNKLSNNSSLCSETTSSIINNTDSSICEQQLNISSTTTTSPSSSSSSILTSSALSTKISTSSNQLHSKHDTVKSLNTVNIASTSNDIIKKTVGLINNPNLINKKCDIGITINNNNKYIKNPQNNTSNIINQKIKIKKMVSAQDNNDSSGITTTATTQPINNCQDDNNSKLLQYNDFDSSEELQYGPGIVSKLRVRYLSLALRQTNGKQRINLDNLRRATSLNNLLDGGGSTGSTNDGSIIDGDIIDNELNDNNIQLNHQQQILNHITTTTQNNHHQQNINKIHKNVSWLNEKDQQQQNSNNLLKNYIKEQEYLNSNNIVVDDHDDDNIENSKEFVDIEIKNGGKFLYEKNLNKKPENFYNNKTGINNNYQHKNEQIQQQKQRNGRQVKRGNDSLKRARSVEALLCEKSSWLNNNKNCIGGKMSISSGGGEMLLVTEKPESNEINLIGIDNNQKNLLKQQQQKLKTDLITIEDKIINARERLHSIEKSPPKRLTSFIDDTERPPPDLVKQTLKLFEATANRRNGRSLSRNTNNQVAVKIANYKSIISQEKPTISYPKPPLSPKRNSINNNNINQTTNNIIIKKPNTLDLKSNNIIVKKSNSPIKSPISNLTKKFSGINENNDKLNATVTNNQQLLSSSSSSPTITHSVIASSPPQILPRNNIQRNNNDNLISPPQRTPDLIPRKHIDILNHQISTDSPVTQLTKKLNLLNIQNSPITTSKISSSSSPPIISTSTTDGLNKNQFPICKSIDELINNDTEDSITSDEDELDEYNDSSDGIMIKRVSKIALENISKAGTTQHFSFNNNNNNINSSKINNEQQLNNITLTKQIGIIRPLITELKKDNLSLIVGNNGSSNNISGTSSNNIDKPQRDNLVISNLNQTKNQLNNNTSKTKFLDNNIITTGNINMDKPALTTREIEKNLINEKKNELANLEINNDSSTSSSSTPPIWQLNKKIKIGTNNGQPIETQNNIMVFNFQDRKDVPDYIENDGLLIKRRRELPKPNESGFVLLGDLTLETSTDPDESWTMGPPSPCNVEFENANIIIDGKSNLRYRSKEISLRVQFDDTLTSTFEYPSESSFIDDSDEPQIVESFSNTIDSLEHIDADEIIQIPNNVIQPATTKVQPISTATGQKSLGNMSLGSAPLGSYTPIKAQIQTNFELGITRVPNNTNQMNGNSNSLNNDNQQLNGGTSKEIFGGSSKCENNKSDNNKITDTGCNNDITEIDNINEPESLQYLKPATDDLTVVYSEGTQKADLLY